MTRTTARGRAHLAESLPATATVGVAPKVTWTTAAAGVLGLTIAALNGLQQNPALLAFLPPWAQWGVLTLLPPLFVALAGYQAPAGDIYVPADPGPIEPAAAAASVPPFEMPPPAEFGTVAAAALPHLADAKAAPEPLDEHDGGWDDWDDYDERDVHRGPELSDVDNGYENDQDQNADTEPRGMRYPEWPYEGGAHESGYPQTP